MTLKIVSLILAAVMVAFVLIAVYGEPEVSPYRVVDLTQMREQVINNTNRLRKAHDLVPLRPHRRMHTGAQEHSEQMARRGGLEHSADLVAQMTLIFNGNWSYAGENIGVSDNLLGLLEALRRSPEHRANILKPQYRRIGVGVKFDGISFWLTVWFKG